MAFSCYHFSVWRLRMAVRATAWNNHQSGSASLVHYHSSLQTYGVPVNFGSWMGAAADYASIA